MTYLFNTKSAMILYFLLSFFILMLNLPDPSSACLPDGPGPDPGPVCSGRGGGGGVPGKPCDPPDPGNGNPGAGGCGASNHITYHSGNINLSVPVFSIKTKCEPISIYLVYNSQGTAAVNGGPFGYNWSFPYTCTIMMLDTVRPGDKSIVRTLPRGSSKTFKEVKRFGGATKYVCAEDQSSWIIENPDGTFTEYLSAGIKYEYYSEEYDPNVRNQGRIVAKLIRIRNCYGKSIYVNYYEDDVIESIEGPEGRTVSFVREGSKITRIVDPDGNEYSLTYSEGDLISYSTPGGITTTFSYDRYHKLLERDTEGATVPYQYNERGQISARTNEDGNTVHSEYDDEEKKTTITDPLGNERVIEYDDGGKLTSQKWFTQTGSLIKDESMIHGADENLISYNDGEGNQTTYKYDNQGQRIERTDAVGNPTFWAYDTDNNLIREVDARENITEFEYDEHKNLIETTWYIDREPVTETLTYTIDGLLESVTNARGYTTSYEYDDYGNPEKITEPLGKETTFTYNIMGQMGSKTEKIDDSTSRTTEYEYNDDRKRIRINYDDDSYQEFHYGCCDLEWERDRNGNYTYYTYDGTHKVTSEEQGDRLTEYEYDENGNLINKTIHNDSYDDQVTAYAYDAANRLIDVRREGTESDLITRFTYTGTDKVKTRAQKLNGDWIITEYFYDELNRVIKVVEDAPSGPETQYGYDANGNRTYVTDAEGRTTLYAYDERNRLVSITNANGVITEYTLDEAGNRVEVIQAAGTDLEMTTEYEYDALNSRVMTTDPLGNETEFSYNYFGNRTNITDANWNVTTFDYDVNGRLTAKTNAESHTTEYEYDDVGNRVRLTDPRGNWTDFSYNQFNEQIEITYPDSSTESFVYDDAGLKRSKTTRSGETITYAYNEFGRLTSKTYPDSSTADFSYDQLGRMRSASNDNAEYEFSYNDLNQLVEVDFSIGSESYEVVYTHDLVGNKMSLEYPSGETYTREYDDLNRLDKVKEGEDVLADYSYNDLNQRTRRDYLNSTWTSYTHNNAGWLMELTNWRTETDVISQFSYTQDNVGNRTSMTTLDGTYDYGYDKIYELTSVDYPSGLSFSDQTFQYDSVWNRTTTINGGTEEYLSNNLNQYTEVDGVDFDYDLNGNLTTDGFQTYYYDCENQLTKVVRNLDGGTLGEYRYDPFGKRIRKETVGITTNYIYDQTSYQVIAEYEDDGGGFELGREFVYGVGIDESLVMAQDEERYYYYRDGLGSVVGLTNYDGYTVKSYNYAAYGNFTTSGSLSGNSYTFTGRRYDSESKLIYYRVRYYSPGIGRFLQKDPIGYSEGINLYAYVFNSPNNTVDPSGNGISCQIKWAQAMSMIAGNWSNICAGIGYLYAETDLSSYRTDPDIMYNPEINGWNAYHCLQNCHVAWWCNINTHKQRIQAMIVNIHYEFCTNCEERKKYDNNLMAYLSDVASDLIANLRGLVGAQSDKTCYDVCLIETKTFGPKTPE